MISDTQSSTKADFSTPTNVRSHNNATAAPEAEQGTLRRRADAVQNRTKLLDAAEAVFLEAGVKVSLDVVAERAGVGRATLFRNFPDRGALIVGLLDRAIDELESEAASVAQDALALGGLLHFVAERIVVRAPLTEIWMTLDHDNPALLSALERVAAVFEKPVAWAVAGGACRADLVVSDVILLVSMLSGALYARAPDTRRRMVERGWLLVCEAAQLRGAPASLGAATCEPG
ncbi:TetR/AcrR family transcriptional regulator [Massilia timonae]|uniref:HTH tetR-type domain-containing protein n=1 Tax=Massilia timonae CCUG 45783 TaxID=883126 RepID=K9DBN9_9BURK|nr:TetR/AcrR family transcriptional regulator [Massilia timonae]EKU82119.1 hypothetical protein HMPREF9710_02567 [Massilia timonae CCUG 45783]